IPGAVADVASRSGCTRRRGWAPVRGRLQPCGNRSLRALRNGLCCAAARPAKIDQQPREPGARDKGSANWRRRWMGRRAKSASAASPVSLPLSKMDEARGRWRDEIKADLGEANNPKNRSGIEIKPLYTPQDWDGARYLDALGFPGQPPMTRGIYATM